MAQILLIICLLFTSCQNSEALEIHFQTEGSVHSPTIRLGDIARFDEETELTRALSSQIVGQAGIPGQSVVVDSLKVKEFLSTSPSLENIASSIKWKGSQKVSVLRQGTKIGTAKIQAIIVNFMKDNEDQLPNAEIRFVPNALPLPFTLPTGNLSYQVIPSNPDILSSSRFSIIFRVDGKVVKNMSVRGKVEALAQVVVSAAPLKKGTVLKQEHLATQLMNISSLRRPGLDLADFIGKKLTRSLRSGVPVLSSMVKNQPVVKRGDRVKIVINSGQLHLTATGLAHGDGVLNDIIRVQNINSRKIVHCRVTAPGRVEVML